MFNFNPTVTVSLERGQLLLLRHATFLAAYDDRWSEDRAELEHLYGVLDRALARCERALLYRASVTKRHNDWFRESAPGDAVDPVIPPEVDADWRDRCAPKPHRRLSEREHYEVICPLAKWEREESERSRKGE